MIPTTFSRLWKLEILNLSSNRIVFFPPVCHMTGLVQMNLASNEITTLSLEIGDLVGMEELNLADNKISGLPFTVGTMCSLTELDLQRNRLAVLPTTLGMCASLLQLRLHSNKLTELPVTLSALTRLEVLTLRDNELGTNPPDLVSSLTNLKMLTLGKNKLIKMPDKELQGDSAFDTTWMLTPRPITPRVDLSKYPESRIVYPSSDEEGAPESCEKPDGKIGQDSPVSLPRGMESPIGKKAKIRRR